MLSGFCSCNSMYHRIICQYTSLLVLCAGCMYSKLYLPLVSSENIVNLTDRLFLDLSVGMR
jgi:hypothetical protein